MSAACVCLLLYNQIRTESKTLDCVQVKAKQPHSQLYVVPPGFLIMLLLSFGWWRCRSRHRIRSKCIAYAFAALWLSSRFSRSPNSVQLVLCCVRCARFGKAKHNIVNYVMRDTCLSLIHLFEYMCDRNVEFLAWNSFHQLIAHWNHCTKSTKRIWRRKKSEERRKKNNSSNRSSSAHLADVQSDGI